MSKNQEISNKDSSNTGKSRKPGTFTKNDPRINKKGRPKSFDTFRELALAISNETVATATKKLGAESVKSELAQLTVAEYILRKWAFSNESKLQIAFSEVAFGKVPIDVNSNIKFDSIKVQVVNGNSES